MNVEDSTTITPLAYTCCWKTTQLFQLIKSVTINQFFTDENMIFYLTGWISALNSRIGSKALSEKTVEIKEYTCTS